jgi:putative Holliday junction resolvase
MLVTLDEVKAACRGERRLLGLDLGEKTIGVAVSDVNRSIASPLETIARTKFRADAARLMEIVRAEDAGALILGLPRNLDGSEGPRAQATRAFVRNLAPFAPPPIALWDERLSTAAVQRAMIDADLSRKKRVAMVDKLAAAFILQGALDWMNAARL